jgi:hypothetical protein
MSLDDRQFPSEPAPGQRELVRRALAIIDEETAAWAQQRFERHDRLPGSQPVQDGPFQDGAGQDGAVQDGPLYDDAVQDGAESSPAAP